VWRDEGVWQEVLVGPEAVAIAFDVDDNGMVQQTIQQGCGDHVEHRNQLKQLFPLTFTFAS